MQHFSQPSLLPRDVLSLKGVPAALSRTTEPCALDPCIECSGNCQGWTELDMSPVDVEGTNKLKL